MTHEFVSYKLAVKLKPIGFDEPCFAFYQREYAEVTPTMVDDNEEYRLTGFRTCKNSEIPEHYVSAPTFSQAFKWFDENTELMGFVIPGIKGGHFDWLIRIDWEEEIESEEYCFSRIEAKLACLTKLIEIVEGQKDSK